MHITAQSPSLRNDLYCVEWDVKLYYTTATLEPTQGPHMKWDTSGIQQQLLTTCQTNANSE